MTHEWSAERTIDPPTAARVIAAQFPELAGLPVRAFDAGWDNVVLTVGDEWLFRFIHREIALPGSRREIAVLRALAGGLPVPIPYPELLGTPTPDVAWPFWGTRLLPGREIAVAAPADEERGPAAEAIGAALRTLHEPDLALRVTRAAADAGVELPVDPIRRGDATFVATRAETRLAALERVGVDVPFDRLRAVLAAGAHLGPASGTPVLVHGDCHIRHVLVDDAAHVTGLIDWGDTALADPAVDLMLGYTAFADAARERFLDAYGPVPPDREARARSLGISVSAMLAQYALAEGLDAVAREAIRALHRVVR